MTLVIGLTGSIGTGKSTIAKKFQQLQIPVIDADRIARQVVEPGAVAYEQIRAHFGEEIIQADQRLDRKKLGQIVFQDEEKRKELNRIIHPAIRAEILRQKESHIAENAACVVLDIPLLFESKLGHYVEKIIVVATDPATQLERVMKRDQSTKEEALSRIQSQIPITEKVKWADAVIDNNGSVQESEAQLLEILSRWGIVKKEK